MTIVLRSFMRSLVRRRALTLVQLAGVACGVAAVVGMILASRTSMESFGKAVSFLQGRASHSLSRPVGPLEETILVEIMGDPAVRAFSPVIDRYLELADGTPIHVLGLDPFLDDNLRPDLVLPTEDDPGKRDAMLLDFLRVEGMVILEARLAASLGISAGGSVVTDRGTFQAAGIFNHPAAEPLILMDISFAQELFGARGKLDRVDLVLNQPGEFLTLWSSRGYQVTTQGEKQGVFRDLLRAFRLNLQALSLLALLVGVFLVYNTSMFRVVSRRKDAGILRSLGATRKEIVAAVTTEIILLGILGGAAGGVLGFVLAHTLTGIVGDTISRLYFFLKPLPPEWSWKIPAAGIVLGLCASLLGGIFPLVQLTREDPVAALRGRVPELSQERYARWTAGAGLIMTILSVLILGRSETILTGYIGAFGVILGLSFMCGYLMVILSPAWKETLRKTAGPVGSIAAGNVSRNLGRTAVAVAAFGVALSLSVGLGSMIGSFRQTLIWWMESQIRGDFYLQATTGGKIPLDLYPELSRLPGVGGVDPYRNATVAFNDSIIRISAGDPAVIGRFFRFQWYEGDDSVLGRLEEGDVIVSESFYRRFGLKPGDRFTLDGIEGPVEVGIAGVFYDYTTEHGLVVMSRDLFLRLFDDPSIGTLVVFLKPDGVRPPGTRERVRNMALAAGLIPIKQEEFRGRILSIFDATFAITHSMRALAILVAFFGIAGALLTLFMERQKEFGIYRALGLTGREVALMTLLEGLGMGLAGFVLSTVAGTAIAFILIRVINIQSFNWTIFFYFTAVPYLAAAGIAIAASAGAAVYPMMRVVKTYPQLQIREE